MRPMIINRSTGSRREPPAVCYRCGGDVEEGPRFGAEACCDDCRRTELPSERIARNDARRWER